MKFAGADEGWYPAQLSGTKKTMELAPGTVVAFKYMPWRVVKLWERNFDLWPRPAQEGWQEYHAYVTSTHRSQPNPQEWIHRPISVGIAPDDAPDSTKPTHYTLRASLYWHTLPEHYSVCHRCGQIPPCKEQYLEVLMDRRREELNTVMALTPSCCLGCQEPMTHRQKTITFPGPNLVRPDFGDDSAIFHARRACRHHVQRYDDKWAAATKNPRRFSCSGFLTKHADGTRECTQGAQCPNTSVVHAGTAYHHHEYAERASWRGCWCVTGGRTPDL